MADAIPAHAAAARRAARPKTPIIALTANAMVHQIADYRAGGMDGHVSKLIEAKELFDAVLSVAELAGDGDGARPRSASA